MKENKKRAVTILLHNDDGDILAVSRKNDLTDFGLIGGKCEPNETDEQAIIRETKEETGLNVSNLTPFFIHDDGEFICTTFIGNYSGKINTVEKGKVIWTDFEILKKGTFGEYNKRLEEHFNKIENYFKKRIEIH